MFGTNWRIFGAFMALFCAFCAQSGAARGPSASFAVRHDCAAAAHCFATIAKAQEAAASTPADQWVTITLGPGDFYEKPTITRPRTRLVGQGPARTRLYFDAVAQTAKAYHRAGWGTPGSATLTVDAADVLVQGLTIENSFDYLANDALPDGAPGKLGAPQAVALLLDIHSDKVLLRHVAVLGYQDTLFANGGRALVSRSTISGNVDFIFGNGQVLIEDSEIRSRRRASASAPGGFAAFIAAPSTPLAQDMGIVVYRSRLTHEAGVPPASVGLARPWHPTTRFADGRYADPNAVGQAVFIDCAMGAHIHPDHWASMNGTARDGTMSAVFTPQTARFYESGSRGAGAKARDIGMRWQGAASIAQIRARLLAGWALP
jgi:pectinesterase